MTAIHCLNNTISGADTAFMAFTTTLVMLQTPAMGIAQAGMLKRKNSLSMLMQTLSGMVIGSILWFLFGFTLTFGPSIGGIIGNFKYAFLQNISSSDCLEGMPADTISGGLFVAYQMMFALMVPVIVTGSWAEKMTFSAFLIFIFVWPIIVYYPIAHWIWNSTGWLSVYGALDFAGGSVIHASSGVAGLIVSIAIQRRKKNIGLAHHNLPLSIFGGCLIWAGWYSFNGGSSYKANFQAAGALLNTHLSACFSAACWVLLSFIKERKWKVSSLINGAFAGLASITAGSGFVAPWASCVIGLISGSISWYAVVFFKEYLNLDDVLDVTSLQGVPGVIGTILVGFFATDSMQPANPKNGLFYGGGASQLGIQVLTASVSVLWGGFGTILVLLLIKHTVRIDVDPEVEEKGLDLCQIGEQAYDDNLVAFLDLGEEALTIKMCEAAYKGDMKQLQELIKVGGDPNKADYDGRTPCHLAASEGRIEILNYLYKYHNVSLTVKDKMGNTPLLEAFRNRRNKTVKYLVAKGAKLKDSEISDFFETCTKGNTIDLLRFIAAKINVNVTDYDKRTALHIACSDGHLECVEILIRAGARVDVTDRWGYTPLDCAKVAKNDPIIEYLQTTPQENFKELDFNPDYSSYDSINENEYLDKSPNKVYDINLVDKSDSNLYEPLLHSSRKNSAKDTTFTVVDRELCRAAAEGNIEEFKRLIKKGAEVNVKDYDQRTPLHLAVSSRQPELVNFICKIKETNINAQDRWHQTPLNEAFKLNLTECARILRENGAIVTNKQIGYKLCKLAAEGNISELNKIAEAGTDLTIGDYDCRTAIHLAAANGHLKIVEFLLANGVKLNCKDRYGNTPLDDATMSKNTEVVNFIQKKLSIENSNSGNANEDE